MDGRKVFAYVMAGWLAASGVNPAHADHLPERAAVAVQIQDPDSAWVVTTTGAVSPAIAFTIRPRPAATST